MQSDFKKSQQDRMMFHSDPTTPTPDVCHHVFETHFVFWGKAFCLRLNLWGSRWKSARCFGSLCEPRVFICEAARSAEDESSAGYIHSRWARNELQEENVRGGSRTLQSASQLH